jgi:hypothetical protein
MTTVEITSIQGTTYLYHRYPGKRARRTATLS